MNYYFVGILILCCVYAFWAGGAPERTGAALYAAAVALTIATASAAPIRWHAVEVGVFIVDVLVFVAFVILAARANRFWPIWVSGLLGLGVLGHLARWAGPTVVPWAYAVVLSIWSYPIMLIIVIGTRAHQLRVRRYGDDRPWSSSGSRRSSRDRVTPAG